MKKPISRALALLCCLVLALTMLAPAFADGEVSVTLDKTTLALTAGGSETLKATISPTSASNKTVTWSTSNSSVAAVSGGTVTAQAAGTATITAKVDSASATCKVTVKAATVSVKSVSLDLSTVKLSVGGTETLTATVSPSNASNKTVTWKSSNTDVATVSDGKVTAVGVGDATITVTTRDGNKTNTCKVTVISGLAVTGVSVDSALTLKKGAKGTLVATVSPFNATDRSVTWSSSDTKVVTVDEYGEVTAKAKGKAVVTVKTKDGGKTATCTITVTEENDSSSGTTGGTTGGNTGTTTPSNPVTTSPIYKPSTPATAENLAKDNWTFTTTAAGKTGFKHTEPNGAPSTGVRILQTSDGAAVRYIFNNDGTVVSGQDTVAAGSGMTVTNDGGILLNGNLYYLNPDRNLSDPRTCYVMMNYLRVRPNYAGQTWYDENGITFRGWMKSANGGLRYQTRISDNYYLIVWRVQDLPACQHPDHPGDPAYYLPAGRYFFDDDGVLVQKEGWNDGKDGKEYYTNAKGMVIQERAK